MAKNTSIEWATATWNPWYGCTKVSPACDNCYAERWAKRCGRDFSKVTRAADKTFYAPLKWKEPQRIFVCSLSDFFHKEANLGLRLEALYVMDNCRQHTFILLTKRPENIRPMMSELRVIFPPNVWLGVTVENQEQADRRIPELLKIPSAVHFISVEPMLGPVDLNSTLGGTRWIGGQRGCFDKHRHSDPHPDGTPGRISHHHHDDRCARGLDWVICGGESGGNARPMHPDWARSLRDQCAASDVPFMFKQWGEWMHYMCGGKLRQYRCGKLKAGRLLDGVEHNAIPTQAAL